MSKLQLFRTSSFRSCFIDKLQLEASYDTQQDILA